MTPEPYEPAKRCEVCDHWIEATMKHLEENGHCPFQGMKDTDRYHECDIPEKFEEIE